MYLETLSPELFLEQYSHIVPVLGISRLRQSVWVQSAIFKRQFMAQLLCPGTPSHDIWEQSPLIAIDQLCEADSAQQIEEFDYLKGSHGVKAIVFNVEQIKELAKLCRVERLVFPQGRDRMGYGGFRNAQYVLVPFIKLILKRGVETPESMIEFASTKDFRAAIVGSIKSGAIDRFRVYSVDDDMSMGIPDIIKLACYPNSKVFEQFTGRKTCLNDYNEELRMLMSEFSIFPTTDKYKWYNMVGCGNALTLPGPGLPTSFSCEEPLFKMRNSETMVHTSSAFHSAGTRIPYLVSLSLLPVKVAYMRHYLRYKLENFVSSTLSGLISGMIKTTFLVSFNEKLQHYKSWSSYEEHLRSGFEGLKKERLISDLMSFLNQNISKEIEKLKSTPKLLKEELAALDEAQAVYLEYQGYTQMFLNVLDGLNKASYLSREKFIADCLRLTGLANWSEVQATPIVRVFADLVCESLWDYPETIRAFCGDEI